MFLFYVLSSLKKGDTIQGGTLFKGGHYLRKYGISFSFQNLEEFRAFIDHYKSSPEFNKILGRQDLNDSIMNPTNLEELGSIHTIIGQLLYKG